MIIVITIFHVLSVISGGREERAERTETLSLDMFDLTSSGACVFPGTRRKQVCEVSGSGSKKSLDCFPWDLAVGISFVGMCNYGV